MRKLTLKIAFTGIVSLLVLFAVGQETSDPTPVARCFVGDTKPPGGEQTQANTQASAEDNLTSTILNNPTGLIKIPVVFHILSHPDVPGTNTSVLTEAKINEQLARLNADMRMENVAELANLPLQWQSLAAITLNFEFVKACIDPQGNITNGIVVKQTNTRFFSASEEFCRPKLDAFGGSAAWSTDTYLNIWICEMDPIASGHATLPWQRNELPLSIPGGGSIDRKLLDGIILDYATVGNPSSSPYYNKGRALTHEVGHWLGLFHLYHFGDSPIPCTPGDFVADTPPQEHGDYTFCPSFPVTTDNCSPGSPGIMFMNYMSHTQDDCKYFFTNGQRTRLRSYFAQNGPSGTRYPFIENYFGFKPFAANPVQASNNRIVVNFKNPMCLPVLFECQGATISGRHNIHQVTLSVPCESSGEIILTATSGNYFATYTFDYVNQTLCQVAAWPKLFEGKAFSHLYKDNAGNLFAWLGSVYNFSNNVNHSGPTPTTSATGSYAIQYTPSGITNWVKTDMAPKFVLNSGDVQMIDMFSYPFYNGVTGNPIPPPPPLTGNKRVIAEAGPGNYITATINGSSGQVHTSTSTINFNGVILKTFFNPSTNRLFIITVSNSISTFRNYQLSGTTLLLLPNESSFTNDAYPVLVDNMERLYMIRNGSLQEYLYNNPTPSFVPVSIPGFINTTIVAQSTAVLHQRVGDKCVVINNAERNLYYLDFNLVISKKIHFTFDPMIDISLQDAIIDGDNIYVSGSVNTSGFIGTTLITFLGTTPVEATLFLAKFSLQGDFSRIQAGGTVQSINIEEPLSLNLFPNPAQGMIKILAHDKVGSKNIFYRVSIFDQQKNIFIQNEKYLLGTNINISELKPGVYYIEIDNEKGEKISKVFIKL